MEELSTQEILNQVRDELSRIHGEKYARMCILEFRGSWYYFSEPFERAKGELRVNPLSKPMQRTEMIALLDDLRKAQPRTDSTDSRKPMSLKKGVLLGAVILLVILFISAILIFSESRTAIDGAIVYSLPGPCELLYFFPPSQPVNTLALACPGNDLVRL